MRVMHCARQLGHSLRRVANRPRTFLHDSIEAFAFDKVHRKVTVAIVLAHFVNRHDAGLIETRDRFRFEAKTPRMRFGRPTTKCDHLEGNDSIETFLPRAINDPLPASADFFEQFVIAEIRPRRPWFRVARFPNESRPVSSRQAAQKFVSAKIPAPHFLHVSPGM